MGKQSGAVGKAAQVVQSRRTFMLIMWHDAALSNAELLYDCGYLWKL